MRASVFNYPPHSDGSVVFNALQRSFIEMTEGEHQLLSKEFFERFNDQKMSELEGNWLVVENLFDVRAFLAYQYEGVRFFSGQFVLSSRWMEWA